MSKTNQAPRVRTWGGPGRLWYPTRPRELRAGGSPPLAPPTVSIQRWAPEMMQMLVDRADMLSLTVPQMTALVGGMRVLQANTGNVTYGVFTNRPGTLSNDFFVNLLDMSTRWSKATDTEGLYEGVDRKTGKLRWMATPVDLVFGSNSELRAVAEFYGAQDARRKFVDDFVAAWSKVMELDRF